MLQAPSLSIIIPVYNVQAYLKNCIDSVLVQTYSDFELILIDDGSTDSSGIICDQYEQQDVRVKVYHQKNLGVSSARNLGLKVALGEWVLFVDSDDELIPSALETFMEYAGAKYDMIECNYQIIKKGERIDSDSQYLTKIIDKKEFYNMFFNYSWDTFHGYAWGKLYRMDIIKRFGLSFDVELHYKEDGLFVCQYVAKCDKIIYTTKAVYKYFHRENSAVYEYNRQLNKKSASHLFASCKIHDLIHKQNLGRRIENDAKQSLCYSYQMLNYIYKHSAVKNDEVKKIIDEMFYHYVSKNFYLYYTIKSKYSIFKRYVYNKFFVKSM